MARLVVQVADAKLAALVDTLAEAWGWTEPDGDKTAWVEARLRDWVRAAARAHRRAKAEAAALAAIADPGDPL